MTAAPAPILAPETPAHALGSSDACLWHARPDRLAPETLDACRSVLGPAERERHARLRDPDGRRRYLVSRALVRCALSAHAAVPPAGWTFRRGAHGKPEIVAPATATPLRFSLSHTRGLVACLVARAEVGVDVEFLGRPLAVMPLARRFLSAAEAGDLRACPRPDRPRRFLEVWTLKEAYLKARGLGLAGGLDALSVRVAPREPIELRMPGDDARRWQLGFCEPSPEHVCAYAIRDARIRLRLVPFESTTHPTR